MIEDLLPVMSVLITLTLVWWQLQEKNLQDPEDGRRVLCDSTLRNILGVDSFLSTELMRLLKPHFEVSPSMVLILMWLVSPGKACLRDSTVLQLAAKDPQMMISEQK